MKTIVRIPAGPVVPAGTEKPPNPVAGDPVPLDPEFLAWLEELL